MAASEVARRGQAPALVALGLCALCSAGCDRSYDGAGELRAQRVVIEREVEGLRPIVQRLERGEPLLPADDIAVAIDEALVRDLVDAQLPFETDVDRFHVTLTDADVQFRGSPTVQLRGHIKVRDTPDITAAVTLFGALHEIRIEPATSTLRAAVTADHLTIAEATGFAGYLSGAELDEAARLVRRQMATRLPTIRIPVKVQQAVELPAVAEGPVRLSAARMPLEVSVSQVVAVRGRLWVSLRVVPGAFEAIAGAAAKGSRR